MSDRFAFPPLNALRAFGAVGRHLSFGQAAEELHVTAAAVSQQIKNLEGFLGARLFHRHGRHIALTKAGRQLFPGIENGFRELEDSVRPFLTPKTAAYISCSTVGAFAARWLVPRLQRWRAAHSDIDIRISASGELVGLEGQGIDLAIRLGTGEEPGLHTELLLREQVVPLCSPILLDAEPPLRHPSDLRRHQLIHFTPPAGKLNTRWTDWLEIAGVDDVDPNRGIFLNDGTAALNAAIAGQGVVLAPRVIASREIEMSTLVIPFEIELPTQLAWYIAIPETNLTRSEIIAFRDWLLAESVR
jgi:LysR family glycine cleavage system transcriptional activator